VTFATVTNLGPVDISLSGSDLTLNGNSSLSGVTYYVLMSTNLAQPLSQWLPVATNIFGTSGNFTITVTNAVVSGFPQRYYILKSQ
jgi:hypothetical protein